MFFTSGTFWFLMGILFVVIVAAFNSFAKEKGWAMPWWKWLLSLIWYAIFSFTLMGWGTLIGENEGTAGFRLLLTGLVVCVILGVGLWRLLVMKPKAQE